MIFTDFKQWYMDNGLIEDLDQFTKSDVVDGLTNLIQIKNKMIYYQRYEVVAHIRSLEKELISYLMIDVLCNSDVKLLVSQYKYKYNGIDFDTQEEIFSYIKTYEKRDISLDKLLCNF